MNSKFFLVGSTKFENKTLNPFDDIICDFFDSLSQDILKKKKYLMTLIF